MRTRELAFVPDVSADPDYVPGTLTATSLICAPLIVDGRFLGLLNVETSRRAPARRDRPQPGGDHGHADRHRRGARAGPAGARRPRRPVPRHRGLRARRHELAGHRAAGRDDHRGDRPRRGRRHAGRDAPRSERRALPGPRRRAACPDAVVGREIPVGEGLAGRAIRDRAIVVDDGLNAGQVPAVDPGPGPADADARRRPAAHPRRRRGRGADHRPHDGRGSASPISSWRACSSSPAARRLPWRTRSCTPRWRSSPSATR